jgi:hypothetical protein
MLSNINLSRLLRYFIILSIAIFLSAILLTARQVDGFSAGRLNSPETKDSPKNPGEVIPRYKFTDAGEIFNSFLSFEKNKESILQAAPGFSNQTGVPGAAGCSTTSISFGQTVNNSLSNTDCLANSRFYDSYNFSAATGQKISIAMNSTALDAFLELYNSNGQILLSNDDDYPGAISDFPGRTNSFLLFTVPADGNFTIRATSFSENETGAYTLFITQTESCASLPISFGETVSGSLSASDCYNGLRYHDRYGFTGTAGQKITIKMDSADFDTKIELFDPDGNFIKSQAGTSQTLLLLELAKTGIYTIRATSKDINKIGSYSIALINNSCTASPISLGQTVNGSLSISDCYDITSTLYYDEYAFTGIRGQKMIITMNSTAFSPNVRLSGSNGQIITFANGVSGARLLFTVPEDGIYTIRVAAGLYGRTGAYTLGLINDGFCNPTPTPVSFGQIVSASLSVSDCYVGNFYYDDYSFSGTTGQKISVTLNSNDFDTRLQLYDSNRQLIASESGIPNARLLFTIPSDGVYTIRAASDLDSENQLGAYTFSLIINTSFCDPSLDSGNANACDYLTVTGRVATAGGLPLPVQLNTADGLKTAFTNNGIYTMLLERGYNHAISAPKLSNYGFSPADYQFNPLTTEQRGKDFTAAILNDDFSDAIEITGESGEVDGANLEAARESGEPVHAGAISGTSIWYRWRAPRSGQFTFSLGGSRFDTLLAVYQGTNINNLSLIAENDNEAAITTSSRVTFTAQANTDYRIAIDGRAGDASSGLFKMIYHSADYAPGFTVTGAVALFNRNVRGAVILAKNLNGEIVAATMTDTNGRYSIIIPRGVSSFTLNAFDFSRVYGSAVFSNVTQNQTYDFFYDPSCDTTGCGTPVIVVGAFLSDLNNLSGLTITVGGSNLNSAQQCNVSSAFNFSCGELAPFGTYTITPSHPNLTFSPASRTFVNLTTNVSGANFIINNPTGFTISGKVTHGSTALSGVKVGINVARDSNDRVGVSFDTETDADGNYSFDKLPPGRNYSLFASLPGFNFQASGANSFTNLQNNQTVNFSASSNCAYTISPLEQNVPAAGGFYFFNVATNAGCAWQARTVSSGFTVTSPLSYGSGEVSYFVEPNAGAARTGIITIGGQTVRINQQGAIVAGRVMFDFDGDRKADISVFRPENGVWYLLLSQSGFTGAQFGLTNDKIVPADYDGDGKTDIAVFRSGIWFWINSSNGTFNAAQFGQAGDIPLTGDFDGDGKNDLTVFRNGVWFIFQSSNAQARAEQFGQTGDKPLVGDFDGDSKADLAVYRAGIWFILASRDGFSAVSFGIESDKTVPADYDGDGKTDFAVYREGVWHLLRSRDGYTAVQFGIAEDLPSPADFDGDGKTDLAVFRNGIWYLLGSTSGFSGVQFGVTNDKPVSGAFVP